MDYTKAPSSYVPSTNSTPTFGQSGAAVLALQKSINAKNVGVTGYVPLKEDGLYGPKTYTAAQSNQSNSNLITPSGNTNTTDTTGNTTGAPAPDVSTTDPILTGLSSLQTANDNATNSLINSTKATYQTKLNSLDKEFENYKGGLQLLGIQTNQAQATPELLMGHIHQAALDQMDKVNALKAEEAKVIMDAKTAKANNDFNTLDKKTARLKEIQTEKNDAIKAVYDNISNQQKVADVEAHDIYDVLQTLDDADKEAFIQAVAKKFNIPVGTLVTSLADEKTKRTKDTNTADPILSPSEAGSLGVPYGTTKSEAAKKNITPTKGSSGSKSSNAVKDADTEITAALNTGKDADGKVVGGARGGKDNDGFVDPYLYIKYFNAYPGTPKQFLAKFPVKGNINPDSYSLLPEAIKPTKTGSSRSTTGK